MLQKKKITSTFKEKLMQKLYEKVSKKKLKIEPAQT